MLKYLYKAELNKICSMRFDSIKAIIKTHKELTFI